MFHHHTKLEHPLNPRDYSSDAFFRQELSQIFDKEWHFVGLVEELASPGDYLGVEVLGMPVVCRNIGGEFNAFRNVCAHRHSCVVPLGRGHRDTLQCQYHGWEYGDEGQVAKITDGASFRGIRAKELGLGRCRIEAIGSLLFINFNAEASSLRETLGDMSEELDYFFGNHRVIWRWANEYPVNWKVIIENAVESYHVPMLHPGTFMDYKKEEHHDHRLEPAFSSYLDIAPMGSSLIEAAFRTLTSLTSKTVHFERAKHVHVFPNHLFELREVYSLFSVVEPLGPERTRLVSMGFLPRDIRLPVINRPIQQAFRVALTRMARKIMNEDVGIWSEVHRGLRHSDQRGVLSSREERVYAFQRYVVDRVQGANAAER